MAHQMQGGAACLAAHPAMHVLQCTAPACRQRHSADLWDRRTTGDAVNGLDSLDASRCSSINGAEGDSSKRQQFQQHRRDHYQMGHALRK